MYRKSKMNLVIMTGILVTSFMTGCGAKAVPDTNNIQTETEAQIVVEQDTEQETEVETKEQSEEKSEPSAEQSVSPVELKEDMFVVKVNGEEIQLGGDMIAYQETIGEADDYSAAKSCLGTGEDKTFTYGDVAIYTKPIDGMDKIYLMEITEETSVAGGISIGSSLAELQTVYGVSDDVQGIEHFYTLDEKTIGFEIENDEITFIEIFGED